VSVAMLPATGVLLVDVAVVFNTTASVVLPRGLVLCLKPPFAVDGGHAT